MFSTLITANCFCLAQINITKVRIFNQKTKKRKKLVKLMSRIIKDKTRQSLPICYEKEVQSRVLDYAANGNH